MSVYVDREDKDAIKDNADEAGFSTVSAYVRSQLTECDDE